MMTRPLGILMGKPEKGPNDLHNPSARWLYGREVCGVQRGAARTLSMRRSDNTYFVDFGKANLVWGWAQNVSQSEPEPTGS